MNRRGFFGVIATIVVAPFIKTKIVEIYPKFAGTPMQKHNKIKYDVGILEQISNQSTYSKLTYKDLQNLKIYE